LVDAAVAIQRDDTNRVLELLEPLRDTPPDNPFLRYLFLGQLASSYAAGGRYAEANRLLDANPIDAEDSNNEVALIAESMRMLALMNEGQARRAARLGAMQLARAEAAHGRRSVVTSVIAGELCDAYYELDRIDDARELLANRAGIFHSSTPQAIVSASLQHARLLALQGALPAALAFLESQAAHGQSLGLDRVVASMEAEQLKILLTRGERARARELAAHLDKLAALHQDAAGARAEIPVIAALARARLCLAEEKPKEALAALAVARERAHRHDRARLVVTADLLAALAHDDFKREDESAACLVDALRSGARLGLVRTFLDEGPRVRDLLERLRGDAGLERSVAECIEDLLGRSKPDGRAPGRPRPAVGDGRDSHVNLTPREVEILGLVSEAMSNKRIALTLNISVDTVKWNVHNILSKLNLASRYEAMTWARKQGLIK